jgi:hypothetical protein
MANKYYNIKIKTAATDPAVTDDVSKAYLPGSYWVNTSSRTVFFLHDNTATAAVWERVDNIKNNSAAADPAVTDDSAAGYEVGSLWVNTSTRRLFFASSVGTGAAVWERIDPPKFNVSTSNPTVTDDSAA